MASSNRHWPSMFKSKPCSPHQWQHDINSSPLLSGACQKPPYTSAPGCEERNPEPKPRWNPKPEQIRILEAIFNSGMVNPPREEIRKIRAQLQEYGNVGDANVFYWFQNRKSRSKHKQRHQLAAARSQPRSAAPSPPALAATSSSSSSSERSTGSDKIALPSSTVAATGGLTGMLHISGSPAASVNQAYFHSSVDFYGEPFVLQGPQGYYISAADLPAGIFGPADQGIGVSPGILGELMLQDYWKSDPVVTSATTAAATTSIPPPAAAATNCAGVTTAAVTNVASPVNEIQGLVQARSTVFINDVTFEVASERLNVREAFGGEAILLHSSGHPVLVDEWGITVQPLQHGASYYLV